MFKPCIINSYLRVPVEELIRNLTPEYKAHLRCVFNIRIEQEDKILVELGANNEVIFHYKDEV